MCNGKLELPGKMSGLYDDWITSGVAEPIALEWRHMNRLQNLPAIHRDPFDRILIAQALEEDLTIVTRDENIASYPGVKTVWLVPASLFFDVSWW